MATTKDDGGSAFPLPIASDLGCVDTTRDQGMSLRDYFAAQAIKGKADPQGHDPRLIVDAYAIADAMLAERQK